MNGAILTFVFVCALVAIYMWIVHSFLRAAEAPEDAAREEHRRAAAKAVDSQHEHPRTEQWAH